MAGGIWGRVRLRECLVVGRCQPDNRNREQWIRAGAIAELTDRLLDRVMPDWARRKERLEERMA